METTTVVIRVDAGAVIITPELVEDALNFYLGSAGAVTVFNTTQQDLQTGAGTELVDPEEFIDGHDDPRYGGF